MIGHRMTSSNRRPNRLVRAIGCIAARLVLALLVFTFARSEALAAPPPIVHAVAIVAEGAATVVTVDLSAPLPIAVFTIADPSRLVVEVPSARFDLAKDAGRGGGGQIVGWRWGDFAPGRARLVFDARRPLKIARADLVDGPIAGRARLVIELVAATREETVDAPTLHLGPAGLAAAAAPLAADRPPTPGPGAAKPVVVIDPGHGGLDAGTVSPATGTPEKTVVLEMARVLAERLRAEGRYEVVMTRTTDVFIGLSERTRIARAHHADLFLSIHADAEYDHSVRGATVYTLAEKASDEQAAALAFKENQSDAMAGLGLDEAHDEVADILADLTLRETRHFSQRFARDLIEAFRVGGRLVKTMPHRQAGLRVLRAHDVPSALIEIGFLSNKEDEALMTAAEWRERTARGLVAAIDHYFVERGRIEAPAGVAGLRHPAAAGPGGAPPRPGAAASP